jgi:hypothetical protein
VIYYLDTEFHERGHGDHIDLISIGMVSEDGSREYYAVCADQWYEDECSDWLKENVLPHLGTRIRTPRRIIAEQIREFVGKDPRFVGYYADYDWVLLCQLYGRMIDLPKGWPMWCYDVKQLAHDLGNPPLPKQTSIAHNALSDAKHIRTMHQTLLALKPFQ